MNLYKVYAGGNADADNPNHELCMACTPRHAAKIAQEVMGPKFKLFNVVKLVQPGSGRGHVYEPNTNGVVVRL
jgi:hypothetical protein